jgi:hypothetical protein
MRHKNRKWPAIAAGVYPAGDVVRLPAGYGAASDRRSIFDRIEREGIRRLEDERAKEAAAGPKSTGERRLNAAGPAFIAARYDATFRVESKTLGTESLSTFPKEEALS